MICENVYCLVWKLNSRYCPVYFTYYYLRCSADKTDDAYFYFYFYTWTYYIFQVFLTYGCSAGFGFLDY